MSKWKIENIERLADTYAGGTPSRSNPEYFKGEIPWISSGEVNQSKIYDTQEKITEDALKNSSAKWIPKNSILVAMYGATAGQVSTNLIDATSNQAVLALIPFKDKIESAFLYYSLSYNKHSILFLTQGTGQPNLSKGLIDSFAITLPKSLLEQTKIAKILSTADAVIEKTQAAIAKYKAIKQGMLQDLFTRGIDTTTNQLRQPYQDAPHLYKESKLGMIPKEWEVNILDEYVSFLRSGLSRLLSDEDIGIPVIISGNIQDSRFDFSNLKYWYLDDPQGADTNSFKLTVGDILICFINSLDQIGKSAIFKGFKREVIYTTNLLRMQSSKNTNSIFLFYLLNSSIIQNELHTIVKPAVNQASFTTKDFLKIPAPLVPEIEQNIIAEKLEAIDKTIDTEQTYLQKIKLLKKGLMEDLLTGIKLVKVEEKLTTQTEN